MKVLHTESSLGWGGQENRTLNEMIGMRERGHEMSLACQPGAKLGVRARETGFAVYETPMRSVLDLPAILHLRRFMRQTRADIVNCHSSRDTQLAGIAARSMLHRPRVVRTRHLALPITSKFTYSVLPDHVVAVSQFVADYLAGAGVPRERICVVPTGIDFALYDKAVVGGSLKEELGLSSDTPLIGTVAILRNKKGHQDILDAVPAVLRQFQDAHFVFAGDGPQWDKLQKRIAAEGLGKRVHMLGLRRDVTNILASLDIFVLPTHQEALGTAFIEAGAMGLPAVATAVDGVPEVVIDNQTGLLVPAHDDEAIARAICTLLSDMEYGRKLGAAAAKHVREKFSVAAMADGMERVYARRLQT